jgi:hypothetical protein
VERCARVDLEPRYALIFDGRRPVAAVAAQRVRIVGAHLKPDAVDGDLPLPEVVGRFVRDRLLDCLDDTMLVCGNLYGGGPTGVALAKGAEPGRIWPGVAEALHRFSYRPIETEPEMVLRLDPSWRTFDDYLAALTKKYRAAARKVRKALDGAGVRVIADDRETPSHALHALYRQVLERADSTPVVLPEDYFDQVPRALGDDTRLTTLYQGETLLGFVVILRDGPTAIGHFVGIDYGANRALPVYFRLLQAVIEAGLAFGCETIRFGRTALDAKARLGARPMPQQVWCRHRHGALNLVIRELFALVDPAEPPERNPFKVPVPG